MPTMYDPAHPGESLRDAMDAEGWTVTETAEEIGCTRQTFSRRLNERTGISPTMALALERIGWSNGGVLGAAAGAVRLGPGAHPSESIRSVIHRRQSRKRHSMIDNPWLHLRTRTPFVLQEDAEAIEAFNRRARPETRIETDLLPMPFVGRIDAQVILLLLNPGVSPDESYIVHRIAQFRRSVRTCHRQDPVEYPNYFLDPKTEGRGVKWWTRALRHLIHRCGRQKVAQHVAALQYMPYRAREFRHSRLRLPSQQFTFQALRAAIRRKAVVLVCRGKKPWTTAVPALARYRRAFDTTNPRQVVISSGCYGRGFSAAVRAIEKAV